MGVTPRSARGRDSARRRRYWTEILAPFSCTTMAAIMSHCRERRERGCKTLKRTSSQRFLPRQDSGRSRDIWQFLDDYIWRWLGRNRPPGSADLISSFRNLHNWLEDGFAQGVRGLLSGAEAGWGSGSRGPSRPAGYAARSEGRGRLRPTRPRYRIAEKAGFVFAGSSEINANLRDTANWPKGVWTLAPTLKARRPGQGLSMRRSG